MNWINDDNAYPKYLGCVNGIDIIANDENHHADLVAEFFPERQSVTCDKAVESNAIQYTEEKQIVLDGIKKSDTIKSGDKITYPQGLYSKQPPNNYGKRK
jgi:hypothetical protein